MKAKINLTSKEIQRTEEANLLIKIGKTDKENVYLYFIGEYLTGYLLLQPIQ